MSRIVELPEELTVVAASHLDSRDLASLSRSLPGLSWLRPDTITYTIPRRIGVIFIMRRMELAFPIVEVRLVVAWRRSHLATMAAEPSKVTMITLSEDGLVGFTRAEVPEEDTASEVVLRVGDRREVGVIIMSPSGNVQEVEVTVVASLDPLRAVRSPIPRVARKLGDQAYFGALL